MDKVDNHIERASKFSDLEILQEANDTVYGIFKECDKILQNKYHNNFYFTEDSKSVEMGKFLITDAYYTIGMIDYNIAMGGDSIPKNELLNMLRERATLSATLQYYEKQFMNQEQQDRDDIEAFTFPSERKPPKNLPTAFYHGRLKKENETQEITDSMKDNIGKPSKR